MMTSEELFSLYRQMVRIRLVEEGIGKRYGEEGQLMRCPVHLCMGQEAIAAGVLAHFGPEDGVFGTHRAHGHYLAKQGNLQAMISELYGKVSGCCQGRGGSMHLIDRDAGFMGAVPIVGATIPLAVGAAWASQRQGNGRIAAVFFGDGCFEEGVLHESMNFAALRRIPVLFVCENNAISVNSRLHERQPDRPMSGIAAAHGIATFRVAGDDVAAVWEVSRQAVARARNGEGPAFLELSAYRISEHCGPNLNDALGNRPVTELNSLNLDCPLKRTAARLQELGVPWGRIAEVEVQLEREINEAFDKAKADRLPEPDEGRYLFAPSPVWPVTAPHEHNRRKITFANAVRDATALALTEYPDLVLIGEGLPSDRAGVFGTTKGLYQQFGPDRVMDMPVSENGLTGVCIGAALRGMRSIMVHNRLDFLFLAMDQLANVAAKWHFLFHQPVPIVIRAIIGRGWGQGPQHSQSFHAFFGHLPGLKVVMPVTARDAKGMLLAAVDDPNPVLFLEHRWLHGVTGEVPDVAYRCPLDRARLIRTGQQVTIAAFSFMVLESLNAADVLASYGVGIEVIDMRSVQPLDMGPVLASVQKTGRLLVADTGWTTCGMGAEIIARVVETDLASLKTAPVRVGLPDHPAPTAPSLTYDYYPVAETIGRRIVAMLEPVIPLPLEEIADRLRWQGKRDVPNPQFTGPF
ncbi:MAG: dehydrogenase [Magnetococcales bacterium]|nr:dehydrogenase [Magnetococcales bacterium]